ncbi:unnamed protein product [Gongylonema pulchrum]|uniref:Uncharacterized protein n=1 Tax=Gongylonema pulchrum TaxID=637853 RepID=A0A3P6SGR3_9BILA|nr:unnamed protein product [Gongylonema pulchrum]
MKKRSYDSNSSTSSSVANPLRWMNANGYDIAYFLGHATTDLTICVPKRAKMLDCAPDDDEELKRNVERRNESYRMAFCYLRDMAERRHSEVRCCSYCS